jgi:hypothetical protein
VEFGEIPWAGAHTAMGKSITRIDHCGVTDYSNGAHI